jgi:hypothetical protein
MVVVVDDPMSRKVDFQSPEVGIFARRFKNKDTVFISEHRVLIKSVDRCLRRCTIALVI